MNGQGRPRNITLEIQNDGMVNVRANIEDLPWVGRIAAAIMDENDAMLKEAKEPENAE